MNIQSNWKLTFDPAGTPLVLLAIGDEIESELRAPLARGMEPVDIIGSAVPFLRPLGNSRYQIQLKIFTSTSLDTTARAAMMDSLIAIDALGKKPLKLEISGITADYYQFAVCYITHHDPMREVEGPEARVSKTYDITATGLTKVTPP